LLKGLKLLICGNSSHKDALWVLKWLSWMGRKR